MKIIIVGLGKVGYAIAQQMVGEEHDLILVDESAAVIEHADATLDAMCVEGNGACASVLLRAGVRDADLVIAATADDEVNLVCSLMAKKLAPSTRSPVCAIPNTSATRRSCAARSVWT